MSEYKLHCFGESGNAYKVALMLTVSGADWKPAFVDFFNGETRTPEYRSTTNEMGEAPVLVHKGKHFTQSGAILHYLVDELGMFGAETADEKQEILRWILFDNHKFTSYLATLRYMLFIAKTGETPVTEFLRGRATGALKIVEGHLSRQNYMVGNRITIADFSMCGYLFYDEELPFNLNDYPNIAAWLDRIKSLPNWKSPYDLMPRAKG
jgi:glutathione S-transferase